MYKGQEVREATMCSWMHHMTEAQNTDSKRWSWGSGGQTTEGHVSHAKKLGLSPEGSGEPRKGLKQENDIIRFIFLKDCSDSFMENRLKGARLKAGILLRKLQQNLRWRQWGPHHWQWVTGTGDILKYIKEAKTGRIGAVLNGRCEGKQKALRMTPKFLARTTA